MHMPMFITPSHLTASAHIPDRILARACDDAVAASLRVIAFLIQSPRHAGLAAMLVEGGGLLTTIVVVRCRRVCAGVSLSIHHGIDFICICADWLTSRHVATPRYRPLPTSLLILLLITSLV